MSGTVSGTGARERGAARPARGGGYGPGVRRGCTEFMNSLRTPTDVGYYVIGSAVFLFVILRNRDNIDETTGLSAGALMLPGVLAFSMIFAALFGLATAVATEREDGTLLRAKSLPHGTTGYVVGQSTRTALEVCFSLTLLLVPGLILLDDGWSGGVWGCRTRPRCWCSGCSPRPPRLRRRLAGQESAHARRLGVPVDGRHGRDLGYVLPAVGTARLGGRARAGLPLYWLGHGLRSAMLPDAAAAGEINGTWQVWESYAVLGAWALLGLVLAPVLLRRMARRESGASMSARKETALQRY